MVYNNYMTSTGASSLCEINCPCGRRYSLVPSGWWDTGTTVRVCGDQWRGDGSGWTEVVTGVTYGCTPRPTGLINIFEHDCCGMMDVGYEYAGWNNWQWKKTQRIWYTFTS